jgi:hypothetical protein
MVVNLRPPLRQLGELSITVVDQTTTSTYPPVPTQLAFNMVLEASMIVYVCLFTIFTTSANLNSVDNSENSRNGDYVPSRWEAQQDAVNLIFSAKTGANPESSVGLMSMGGNTPEILTTLTTDIGKVLDGLHRTKIKGSSHFVTGVNVAAVCH